MIVKANDLGCDKILGSQYGNQERHGQNARGLCTIRADQRATKTEFDLFAKYAKQKTKPKRKIKAGLGRCESFKTEFFKHVAIL